MSTIRDAVWKTWKADEFMAPPEKHHSHLRGDSKKKFDKHVSDVESHAKKYGISDPMKAVVHHADSLIKQHFKKEEKMLTLDQKKEMLVNALTEIKEQDPVVARAADQKRKENKAFLNKLLRKDRKKQEKQWRNSEDFHAKPHLESTDHRDEKLANDTSKEADEDKKKRDQERIKRNRERSDAHMDGIRRTDKIALDIINRKREQARKEAEN